MNFSELYKKIADLDNRPMTESDTVESCGSPMGSSPIAQQDTVSVSVNMNGSGAGGIRDLMAILKNPSIYYRRTYNDKNKKTVNLIENIERLFS